MIFDQRDVDGGTPLQLWEGRNWFTAVTGLNVQAKPQQIAVVFEANGTARVYLNGQKGPAIRSSFDFKGVKAGLSAPFLGQYASPFDGELKDFQVTKMIRAKIGPQWSI